MIRIRRILLAEQLQLTATCHVQNELTTAVKVKFLLDAGSQRNYISERIWKFLNLSTEAVEDVNISTFGNSQTLSKSTDRVLLVAKTNSHHNILIKTLYLPMLSLPISNHGVIILNRTNNSVFLYLKIY